MKLVLFILLFAAVAFAQHTFDVKGENFLLDGKPIVIRSGEMHYPRVPRADWRTRFKQAKALGLNTITTYVFWNLHEKEPGVFDFSGNLDVAEYVRVAKEEGLLVIVRPGPYICTEWDFGGIPAWLIRDKAVRVRTKDPKFLEANARYMKKVAAQLLPLQVTKGGNVIMVQIENEYGSFGDDHDYMNAVKKSITDAGFDVPLFTSDGPGEKLLAGGTLPGVTSVINFDSNDDIAKQFESFAKFRTGVPRMVGEYWIGWFDHWGEKRHTKPAESVAKGVEYLLKNNISFNLYMFHGGSTFGFMAGANYSRRSPYEPDTSAYDYDSPIDEAGRMTPKYHAIRDVMKKYVAEPLPELVADSKTIEFPRVALGESASFDGLLKNPVTNAQPLGMDDLGQNHGFMLYRRKFDAAVKGNIFFDAMRDYAHIFANRKLVGTMDRGHADKGKYLELEKNTQLDIVVENMGRINFGVDFIMDRKGLFGKATFNDVEIPGWQTFRLPLDNLKPLKFSKSSVAGAVFFRGRFTVKGEGGTFIDTRGWGKGHVWVNGHHLGRFWKIGPQQTLFCPASWLKQGTNEIVVLDLENTGNREIAGLKNSVYGN